MRYYPINLDIRGRPVVVIGGGQVALRKIEGLLEAGARLRVVDPRPLPEVRRLAEKGKITLVRRAYRKGDLGRAFAAVASTDDRQVNLAIRGEAKRKRILLNIVDRPAFCDFVFPSRIQRGEFMVTISTGGASPALSRKVREELEEFFGPEYGVLVDLLGRLRKKIPPAVTSGADKLFTAFVRSPVLAHIRRGDWGAVDRLLQSIFGVSLRKLGVKTGRK